MAKTKIEDDWVDVGAGSSPESSIMWNDLLIRLKEIQAADPCPNTDPAPFYKGMRRHALKILDRGPKAPLFHVDLGDSLISTTFEEAFPVVVRQDFRCKTCAKFMDSFGDLCLVCESTGRLVPLFWDAEVGAIPEVFREPVRAVMRLFEGRRVSTEYRITSEKLAQLGKRRKGGQWHMAFTLPNSRPRISRLKALSLPPTDIQIDMLQRILRDYSEETVSTAAELLLEDRLPYADGHKDTIRWLLDTRKSMDALGTSESSQHNLVAHRAASAFVGCLNQLRSGALSTLLHDIEDGKQWDELYQGWWHVCHPQFYMRKRSPGKETSPQRKGYLHHSGCRRGICEESICPQVGSRQKRSSTTAFPKIRRHRPSRELEESLLR
jgi:hypothetical protein